MENKQKYSGVIVPMVTPFNADLTIDILSVSKILKTFTFNKVSTFILGTTGESVSIPADQRSILVETTVNECRNKIRVYAGISGNCLRESIDSGNRYAAMGVDAVVIHLPFYYPISDNAMIWYFEAVADTVKCPVIVYNNPLTVRWSIPLEVIDRLSHHPNIVGLKDSQSGLNRVDESVRLWSKRTDFTYLMGCAAQSAYALLKGCDGIVPSAGNLIPELYRALYEYAGQGNEEEAYKFQNRTDRVTEIYQANQDISHAIPALKAMMAAYDLCKPVVMPPMYETSPEVQDSLRQKTREVLDAIKKPAE